MSPYDKRSSTSPSTMSNRKIRPSRVSTVPVPHSEDRCGEVDKWAEVRAPWRDVAGILAENLALHLANMALFWANSARRRRLGLPPR